MSSRREFITTIVLGSGAVFLAPLGSCTSDLEQTSGNTPVRVANPIRPLVRTPQFKVAHTYLRDGTLRPQNQRNERHDVVVVGGGVSGLAAGFVLQQEGVDVVVIESEQRAGGAAVSQRLGGQDVPLGSVYFVDRTEELSTLIEAAGVKDVQCPDDAFILANDMRVRNIWSDETLALVVKNVKERDQMKRFRDTLAAMDADLPSYPLPEQLSASMRSLDQMSARDYAERYQSPFLDMILNAYSRSSMGAPMARTNAYCLLNFYQSELGDAFGYPRYSFSGGISRLSGGIASRIQQLRSSEVAIRVRENGGGVEVDTVSQSGEVVRYSADHAVVAVPKFQLPALLEEIDTQRAKACQALTYAPYATIQVVSSEPLVNGGSYDTWDLRTQDAYTDIINPTVLTPGATDHVISLYVPLDASERHVLQDDQAFAERVALVVRRFCETIKPELVEKILEVHAWGWGHGIVVPTPGSHSGIAQRASAPTARIEFAGTDADAAPAIENAVHNGFRAAGKIIAKRRGKAGN